MSVTFNAATAANVNILRTTNELFQVSQKRVATGKSIFGASDDATRYTMSQTMLSRSKNIDSVNNNISTALKTLESTDVALKQVRKLLGQMVDMATQAYNAGSASAVTAGTFNIQETTVIGGIGAGQRLSITADDGKNFTFTVGTAGTANWGMVANALSAANIGVELKFDTAASTMTLRSTNGATGFTIDGNSAREIVDDLAGLTSAYEGAFNATMFQTGSSAQGSHNGTKEYGMHFGGGGAVRTASSIANTGAATGSSLSFIGSDGLVRTWANGSTTTSVQGIVDGINGMNAGVRAEIVTGGFLQLRRTDGGVMTLVGGDGAQFNNINGTARFNATAGASPVVTGNPVLTGTNNDRRLELGAQFESYKTEITNLINNNVVQAGRNLLRGQGMTIILNEFAANPISVQGVNTTVTGNLGLTSLGANWTTTTAIQTSLGQAQTAQQTIDSIAAGFGTYASFVKDRYEMNREFASDMKSLGDDLVAADVAEESAKLTALQTQQQFAVQAFSAGSQNAQGLLRLLG
jgi:flagellin